LNIPLSADFLKIARTLKAFTVLKKPIRNRCTGKKYAEGFNPLCNPKVMLNTIAKANGIKFVSLESKIACDFGYHNYSSKVTTKQPARKRNQNLYLQKLQRKLYRKYSALQRTYRSS
jgi:hypothetical protein